MNAPRPSPPDAARRRGSPLLLSALLLCLAFASACSAGGGPDVRIESLAAPSATPTAKRGDDVLLVAVAPGLRDLVEGAAPLVSESAGRALVMVEEGAQAELRLTSTAIDGTDPVIRRWSVVATAARLDLDSVARGEVERAAAEGRLFAASEHIGLVRGFFPDGARIGEAGAGALAARLAAVPGAFGLMPSDRVTARVRALALDGVDPATGAGDLGGYPYVTRGRVEVLRDRERNAPLAAALSEALGRGEPPPLRVTFTGDLIPARCVYDQMRRTGDWSGPFRQVAERLSGAAITAGSLDAAISARGTPIGCRETLSLLAPPQVVQGFTLAGFDVITVATNHVKDCGESGGCGDASFLDTLDALRDAGIRPVGGGTSLAEARRPVVVEAGGVRFAFLGYDDIAPYYNAGESRPGTAPLDDNTLAEDIRAARRLADVVVVMPQWGEEYTAHPTARQRQLAAMAIEAGATLVIGNHPHTVQAAAPQGEGYVAYALGNFVFDQDWSRETTEGVICEATFRGARLVAVRFVPVRVEQRLRVAFLGGAEGKRVLDRMSEAAAQLAR